MLRAHHAPSAAVCKQPPAGPVEPGPRKRRDDGWRDLQQGGSPAQAQDPVVLAQETQRSNAWLLMALCSPVWLPRPRTEPPTVRGSSRRSNPDPEQLVAGISVPGRTGPGNGAWGREEVLEWLGFIRTVPSRSVGCLSHPPRPSRTSQASPQVSVCLNQAQLYAVPPGAWASSSSLLDQGRLSLVTRVNRSSPCHTGKTPEGPLLGVLHAVLLEPACFLRARKVTRPFSTLLGGEDRVSGSLPQVLESWPLARERCSETAIVRMST